MQAIEIMGVGEFESLSVGLTKETQTRSYHWPALLFIVN